MIATNQKTIDSWIDGICSDFKHLQKRSLKIKIRDQHRIIEDLDAQSKNLHYFEVEIKKEKQ